MHALVRRYIIYTTIIGVHVQYTLASFPPICKTPPSCQRRVLWTYICYDYEYYGKGSTHVITFFSRIYATYCSCNTATSAGVLLSVTPVEAEDTEATAVAVGKESIWSGKGSFQ